MKNNNTTYRLFADGTIVVVKNHSWFRSLIDFIKNRADYEVHSYVPVKPYSKVEEDRLYELLRRNTNLDMDDIVILVNCIRPNTFTNNPLSKSLDTNRNYVNATKKTDIYLLKTIQQV